MYNINSFITKLKQDYPVAKVDLDIGQEVTLASNRDAPSFLLSYKAVNADDHVLGDGIAPDNYNAFASNFRQIIEVKCNIAIPDFALHWNSYKKVLENWNPIDTELEYSSLFYLQGQRQGFANGRIIWLDYWGIDFPRVTVLP